MFEREMAFSSELLSGEFQTKFKAGNSTSTVRLPKCRIVSSIARAPLQGAEIPAHRGEDEEEKARSSNKLSDSLATRRVVKAPGSVLELMCPKI